MALFQSTHPSWGATKISMLNRCSVSISIHAPIVGCDLLVLRLPIRHIDFNPRTHRGVRPTVITMLRSFNFISIHAPIVGCDLLLLLFLSLDMYFNPRTHRGVRLQCIHLLEPYNYFNPRTHRGVRLIHYSISLSSMRFQSTHPSWGATEMMYLKRESYVISIHAPIVGCDVTP